MNNFKHYFITKCAELNLDPDTMIKLAAEGAAKASSEGDKGKGSKLIDTISAWGKDTWNKTKNDPTQALLGAAGGVAATSLIAGILSATKKHRIKKQLRRKTQAALQEGKDLSNEDLQALLAAKGLV
jgi:hypothetical protein